MAELNLFQASLDHWQERWENDSTPWHRDKVHSVLIRSWTAVLQQQQDTGAGKLRVLVPLCGKTVDMKWLAKGGNEVVGVEVSDKAIKDFYNSEKLPFNVTKVETFVCYQCSDENYKIKVYQGDMFNSTSEILGHFDVIWDKGGLVAINVPDRERYCSLLLSLLKPRGSLLLCTYDYNQEERLKQPYSIPAPTVQQLFGRTCDIQLLETVDLMIENPQKFKFDWKLTRMDQLAHLIQKYDISS